MSISSIPANSASAITPFNPLGKQAVGEEEKDSKNSSLKAVEESAESEHNTLRKDGKSSDEIVTALKEDEREQQQRDKRDKEEARADKQDQEEIRQLAARDRAVRDHERAHAAVGGQYAGAPSYRFKRGPDGVNYATAGEVSIDTGSVRNDPQATINKARQIRRAALAPADPSPQDRRVAAQATQMEITAKEDLSDKRRETVEKEKAEAQQRADSQKQTAATAAENNNESGREGNKDVAAATRESNQHLVALNRSYLSLDNQNNRLGSIVSQAV